MALVIGDEDCTTGLAGRILAAWLDYDPEKSGFVQPVEGAALNSLRALAYGVAKAVVDEIQANAAIIDPPSTPLAGFNGPWKVG